jgi:hypothetical protein
VNLRVLAPGYEGPDGTGLIVELSHDPVARFPNPSQPGATQSFVFSDESQSQICRSVQILVGGNLGCDDIGFFEKTFHTALSKTTSDWQALSTADPTLLGNNRMYGTSLRGVWHIDITRTLDQLRDWDAGDNRPDQCPSDPEFCTAEEAFWRAFRGIQYEVFYVDGEYGIQP